VSNMSSRGRRATVGVVALNGLFLSAAVACGSGAPPVATGSVTPASASATSTPSAEPLDLEGTIILGTITGSGHVVYLGNADGTDLEPLADPDAYGGVFRISPDRTRIMTMPGTDETGAVRGGRLDLATGRFTLLPQPDLSLNLVPQAWSPDGTRIAFEGWDESDPSRTGVYTARAADGGDLVRVTRNPGLPHVIPLDFSPDGTQIVFYRSVRSELDFPVDIGGSLWVVNVDGSHSHKLSMGDVAPWWQARWSPDGSVIVFSTERLHPSGALWTIKPDGTGLTKLYEDPAGGYAITPVWSPDGTQLMFSLNASNDAFVHSDNAIYVINADGTNRRVVMDGPGFKGIQEWWE
jgi:Tol biopolymer transport system component